MQEIRIFNTLLKDEHKFSKNEFVIGKVTGYADIIFETCERTCWGRNEEDPGRYFAVKCDEQTYKKFINIVEKYYPGLCEFDCESGWKGKFIL